MSRNRMRFVVPLALVAAAAATAGTALSASASATHAVSGKLAVTAVWSGAEQKSFEAVLAGFKKANPGISVKYTSSGDQLPTVLGTAVTGGNPPDIAVLPQPGLMKDFAKKKALKPLTFLASTMKANFAPVWGQLGSVGGKQYGLIFKGANKSTIWYNVAAFKAAGVTAPTTWPALLTAAKTIKASGTQAFSIGGADGWTLTDLFENIYLRQAGGAKYDQLSSHKIKWTDPSVKTALKAMAGILEGSNIAGGTAGALQIDFPTSVSQVFASPPKAAMVMEGDFVAGVITSSTKAKPISGFNEFAFPAIGASGPVVVGGGDTVVMFKDSPAARALVTYLASAQAGTIWAHRGGFSSPNKNVKASVYPDAITRKTAVALAVAKGGTVGQGEFKDFQDLLKNPSDIDGVAAELEADAAKAYK